jgi:DNA-binding MarR family transcriptional regulator
MFQVQSSPLSMSAPHSRAASAPTAPRAAGTARTSDPTAALEALRRIVRALGVSSRTSERSAGVTGAQLFVLQQLSEAAAHSLNDLADRTFTHQSTASVVVERLVSRGLVARTRSAADARRVELALTATGRAALRRAPPPAQSRLVAALHALSPRDCRALARVLGTVVRSMKLAGGPPGMFFEEPSGRTAARDAGPRSRRSRSAGRHVQAPRAWQGRRSEDRSRSADRPA